MRVCSRPAWGSSDLDTPLPTSSRDRILQQPRGILGPGLLSGGLWPAVQLSLQQPLAPGLDQAILRTAKPLLQVPLTCRAPSQCPQARWRCCALFPSRSGTSRAFPGYEVYLRCYRCVCPANPGDRKETLAPSRRPTASHPEGWEDTPLNHDSDLQLSCLLPDTACLANSSSVASPLWDKAPPAPPLPLPCCREGNSALKLFVGWNKVSCLGSEQKLGPSPITQPLTLLGFGGWCSSREQRLVRLGCRTPLCSCTTQLSW